MKKFCSLHCCWFICQVASDRRQRSDLFLVFESICRPAPQLENI